MLAVVAFVSALFGFALVAVPLGHVARKQIRERGESGDAFAVIALVLGYPWFALVFLLLPAMAAWLGGGLAAQGVGGAGYVLGALLAITLLALEVMLYARWVKGLGPGRTAGAGVPGGAPWTPPLPVHRSTGVRILAVVAVVLLGLCGAAYTWDLLDLNNPPGEGSRQAAPSGTAVPTEMTFGAVSFRPPSGWISRAPSGGTTQDPLVELAPDPSASQYIAVWSHDTAADPSLGQAAVESEGMAEPTTIGGKAAWTYKVSHTISSKGDQQYLLSWYYLFDGNTRVDVACDSLHQDAAIAELNPTCERFVESVEVHE